VTLIDDLLDVSRITRGMITLQREPVLVGAIVARAVETARPAIDVQRHDLTLELPDELITVDGDKTRLIQVFANILHNASKFMDPGGRIHLKVARDGAHVAISVSDTGIGISPELLPKVFELFTQVHSQSERAQGGLGIGLALVRRLVEMHGGTVTARSDGLGSGSEFTVRIPAFAAEKAVGTHANESAAIAVTEPRRILVADDNRDAAESLTLRLQLAGHEVRAARDGVEALEVGKAFRPDIVLLDLGMPKMDGCEAARRMRRSSWGKSVTLVALTGWGQQQDRERTSAAGFDIHLVKPVSESQLFDAIASAGKKGRSTGAAEAG
jgi:two-component system CheB/CheR fusion protein